MSAFAGGGLGRVGGVLAEGRPLQEIKEAREGAARVVVVTVRDGVAALVSLRK